MPSGKTPKTPSRAPVIIFGAIIGISVICVSIVLITHSQRTEPYLDSKRRRIKRMQRPAPVPATRDADVPAEARPRSDR